MGRRLIYNFQSIVIVYDFIARNRRQFSLLILVEGYGSKSRIGIQTKSHRFSLGLIACPVPLQTGSCGRGIGAHPLAGRGEIQELIVALLNEPSRPGQRVQQLL